VPQCAEAFALIAQFTSVSSCQWIATPFQAGVEGLEEQAREIFAMPTIARRLGAELGAVKRVYLCLGGLREN